MNSTILTRTGAVALTGIALLGVAGPALANDKDVIRRGNCAGSRTGSSRPAQRTAGSRSKARSTATSAARPGSGAWCTTVKSLRVAPVRRVAVADRSKRAA